MISILVVEDNKLVQELIAILVHEKFGVETIQSTYLDQAKQDVLMESPDLIILDLNLQTKNGIHQSGIDLLKWMQCKNKIIPTILFSGEKKIEAYVECAKIGLVDVVYKEADTFHSDLIKSIGTFIKTKTSVHKNSSWLI